MAKLFQEELEIKVDESVRKLAVVDSRLSEINQKLQTIRSGGGAFAGMGKDIESGEKALRGFLREQLFQDRITRQATQTIFNMAAAFSFLAGSGEGSLSKLHKGLITGAAAANTMEVALFTLGQAGARMGGPLGLLLTRFAALGGPIALIVGVGAGLLAFFDDVDKKAGEAADGGLKRFEERFKGLSEGAQRGEIRAIESVIARQRRRLESTNRALNTGFADEDQRQELEIRKKLLIEEIARNQAVLDSRVDLFRAAQDERKLIQEEGGDIQRLQLEIEELRKRINEYRGDRAGLQKLIDDEAGKEKQLADLRKSTAGREKEEQEKRNKASEAWSKQLEEQIELERELEKLLLESDIALPDVPLEEIARARAELIENDIERTKAVHKAERDIIQRDIDEAARKGEDTQLLQMKLAKDRKDEEEEIAEIQRRSFEEVAGRWERLLSILQTSLIGAGDDFVRKMITALQIAVEIAKTLKAINAKKEGADLIDTLTVIAQLGGLFGGLGFKHGGYTGGYTGGGPAYEPAGIVHRGEVVFERDITQRNLAGLLALRSELQQGIPLRQALRPQIAEAAARSGGTQADSAMMSVLIREVSELRRDVKENRPIIIVKDVVTMSDALRQFMPEYEKHVSIKNID